MSGIKRALLIGLNYPGTNAQLNGCYNDTKMIREILVNAGYTDITVMTDDLEKSDPHYPTKANILAMFANIATAPPNSKLFVHYSGHGTQVRDISGDEDDGKDEALCPADFMTAGFIVDDEIFQTLVKPLDSTVVLHSIMDCCHSGSIFDLKYNYKSIRSIPAVSQGKTRPIVPLPVMATYNKDGYDRFGYNKYGYNKAGYNRFGYDMMGYNIYGYDRYGRKKPTPVVKPPTVKPPTVNDVSNVLTVSTKQKDANAFVCMWSGCKDAQTSADAYEKGRYFGAMSNAFYNTYKPGMSYDALTKAIWVYLQGRYEQIPQMSFSKNVDPTKPIDL